jgi:hypothetical protein
VGVTTAERRSYLVEAYRPGATADDVRQASRRLAAAASALALDGEPIRFVSVTFVPVEESCFFRFEGTSADLVARACAVADVPPARIHAVLDLREERCDS